MTKVFKLYRWFNVLSFDVVAGAIIGSLFFARIYSVTPSFISLVSLGLTVWVIYTVDRLLDIQDLKGTAASERHRFHQRNRKNLIRWLFVVMIIDIGLAVNMPEVIIIRGSLLSFVVVIYIILRRRLHVSKELLVAILYTAGVMLPVWPGSRMDVVHYLPILLFFLIALINLIIFSWFERENDLRDHQNSVATLVDEKTIRKILIGLFIIIFAISFYLFLQPVYHIMSLVFLAMTSTLFLIYFFNDFFSRGDYYRVVGDAVFLFPFAYILA